MAERGGSISTEVADDGEGAADNRAPVAVAVDGGGAVTDGGGVAEGGEVTIAADAAARSGRSGPCGVTCGVTCGVACGVACGGCAGWGVDELAISRSRGSSSASRTAITWRAPPEVSAPTNPSGRQSSAGPWTPGPSARDCIAVADAAPPSVLGLARLLADVASVLSLARLLADGLADERVECQPPAPPSPSSPSPLGTASSARCGSVPAPTAAMEAAEAASTSAGASAQAGLRAEAER